MGITPGMAIGALGLAGGLGGLFSGNTANASVQPWMQNFGQGAGAAGQAIGGLGGYNVGAQFLPGVAGIGQAYMANPYTSGFQGTANQFAPLGVGNALGAIGNAGAIGGTVPTSIGAGNAILNTAFDPQAALYGRTAQQVADQSLAGLSNAGLATTPWGQGVFGKTMGDFNIDWQNAQLARQAQGITSAEGAYGGAGTAGTTGLNLGQGGVGAGVTAGGIPMDAYNQILSNQLGGLNAVAGFGNTVSAIPQTQAGDWLNYMTGQLGAGQLALGAQGQGFNQQQTLGRDIGGSLGLLTGGVSPGQMYGNYGGGWPGSSGGSNNPYLIPPGATGGLGWGQPSFFGSGGRF